MSEDARQPESTVSPAAATGSTPPAPAAALTEDVVKAALRRVKDPELNLNIVDLGLVYGVTVDGGTVTVAVTLTSPGCPSGAEILTTAEERCVRCPASRTWS